MDRQDAVIATLREEHSQRVPNARRQEMLAHVDKFKDEEDQASLNNEGRFMPKGEWRGSDFQRDPRWQDGTERNPGNIKMKILSFQGKNDLEAYFKWEKKVELIFGATTTPRRKR